MSEEKTSHVKKATLFPLIVSDQDETLEFYTEKLGFEKKGDMDVDGDRWLTIAAPQQDVQILLQPPDWFEGKQYYGEEVEQYHDLVGRNPAITYEVDDCWATYEDWSDRGVEFFSEPRETGHGIDVVALDNEGNQLLLTEPAQPPETSGEQDE